MNEPNPGDLNPPEDSASADFATFARQEGYIEDTIDPVNNFAIKGENATRDYFAINPSGGFSANPIYSAGIGEAGVSLIKRGRDVRDYWETSMMGSEQEKVDVNPYYSHYSLYHLKGRLGPEAGFSHLSIAFSSEGKLVDGYLDGIPIKDDELEEHFKEGNKPIVYRRTDGWTALGEDSGDSYIFYWIDSEGNPDAKIIIKKKIDSCDEIMEALGVDELIKNPTQPAHGVEGKSHGDDEWRAANFADKMGVHVTPIDNPEELAEFESKGFGKLIANIAKKI